VLLCAFARAAGIPSRVVMGVTCIGDAFGGHAWTEVWIGGEWYALDGTLAQGSADATHITFSRLTLEDAAGAEVYVGLLQGLGNLEIDPVELVIAGRTLRPADDAGHIEGDRYASRLWSLSFTCPEGFEFDPPAKTTASMTASIMQLERKEGKGCEIEVEATETAIWDMIVSADGRKLFDSVEETTIDGRKALRVAKRGMRGVIVRTELGVFTFMLTTQGGDADAQAFEALVASVDFDVK
jgi:hypothetical protein